ncbi:MAG: hypothetical protein A2X45_00015 [Lentisphaerae bacterium GWF2_50_93]|nr:MAG: hypothetical protein A2X45_00015 [Lentisphaerae bacterium GWF2_50_93]
MVDLSKAGCGTVSANVARITMAGLMLAGIVAGADEAIKLTASPQGCRIGLLGDSLTDGATWPLLIRQAMRDAVKPVPRFLNCAVGGATAGDNIRPLDEVILPAKPDMIILFCSGGNDLDRKTTVEQYSKDMEALVKKICDAKIPLLILRDRLAGPKFMESEQKDLVPYWTATNQLSKKYVFNIAKPYDYMKKAWESGKWMWEDDQNHFNLEGNRCVARTVLDALGHQDVPLPDVFSPEPLPGIVCKWRFRPAVKDAPPLDEKSVRELKPDGSWKDIVIPDLPDPKDGWWWVQVGQEGYWLKLNKELGEAPYYIGMATISSQNARKIYLNIGGSVRTVWINGKLVFRENASSPRGFHYGRERIPVELPIGESTVVVETGNKSILSLPEEWWW